MGIGFFSCDTYHFAAPLPTDAVNIYSFPKEALGMWTDEVDHDTVVIKKRVVEFHSYEKQFIIFPFGAWKNVLDIPGGFTSFKSVKYDSGLKRLDTVSNYIIKNNLIYEKKNGLQGGCPFTRKNDTLISSCKKKFVLELGEKFFLRKITDQQYMLNIHESIVIKPESEWWQILLMEMESNKRIKTYFPNSDLKKEPSLIYQIADEFYFTSSWTKADIQKKIQEKLFSNKYKFLSRIKK
jgi:hypothetical protein